MNHNSRQSIKRFPRLTTGAQATAFGQLLWSAPEIEIRFRKSSHATQFIFTVPVPLRFRKSYADVYRLIFNYFDWENALDEAFRKGRYGGKQLSDYMSSGLHKSFIDAIDIWLTKTWGLEGYEIGALKELDIFRRASRSRTGPQPNLQAAWWAANRFNELCPRIRKLRQISKGHAASSGSRELTRAIEKVVPWHTVHEALGVMLAAQASIEPRHFFLSPRISNQQITTAIIGVELQRQGYDLKKISLRKYLRIGRDILKLLS